MANSDRIIYEGLFVVLSFRATKVVAKHSYKTNIRLM